MQSGHRSHYLQVFYKSHISKLCHKCQIFIFNFYFVLRICKTIKVIINTKYLWGRSPGVLVLIKMSCKKVVCHVIYLTWGKLQLNVYA